MELLIRSLLRGIVFHRREIRRWLDNPALTDSQWGLLAWFDDELRELTDQLKKARDTRIDRFEEIGASLTTLLCDTLAVIEIFLPEPVDDDDDSNPEWGMASLSPGLEDSEDGFAEGGPQPSGTVLAKKSIPLMVLPEYKMRARERPVGGYMVADLEGMEFEADLWPGDP
ncbi:hypothetical protein VTI74DRAFT_706 [Chaetomium olivicolor]